MKESDWDLRKSCGDCGENDTSFPREASRPGESLNAGNWFRIWLEQSLRLRSHCSQWVLFSLCATSLKPREKGLLRLWLAFLRIHISGITKSLSVALLSLSLCGEILFPQITPLGHNLTKKPSAPSLVTSTLCRVPVTHLHEPFLVCFRISHHSEQRASEIEASLPSHYCG